MAIKNALLGGTDMGKEEALSVDFNDTFDGTISIGSQGSAQNAYQILQANNVFENKDLLAADEFTDADGTNDTINTGSTTAPYDSTNDLYSLTPTVGSAESSTTVTTNSGSGTSLTMTVSPKAATGFINQIQLSVPVNSSGDIFTATIKKSGNIIAKKSFTSVTNSAFLASITLTVLDYSELIESGDTITVELISSSSIFFTQTSSSYTGTDFDLVSQTLTGGSGGFNPIPIQFTDATYSTSSLIVLADTNTLTLDGTEKSICVYTDDKNTSANANITVKAGDGSTQTSAQTITNNFSSVFDISTLGAGILDLEFSLNSSNNNASPLFKGYAVKLIR